MALKLAALDAHVCERLSPDAFVVFVAEDERPLWGLAGVLDWKLAGGLTRLLERGDLAGRQGESLLTVLQLGSLAPRVLAFGIGPQAQVSAERFQALAKKAAEAVGKAKFARVAVGLPELPKPAHSARALADAFGPMKAEVSLVGELQDLALALPEYAK